MHLCIRYAFCNTFKYINRSLYYVVSLMKHMNEKAIEWMSDIAGKNEVLKTVFFGH
ncbi:hypothetical protein B4168_0489 [Anoxybacillus flavithermus]|nr:hypothetical protein B4168_0489 [Anoxybacillus flavithermus]